MNRIMDHSFAESKTIRKGLGEAMGGQILELESDRLIKQGEELGEARGKEIGKKIGKEIGADNMASLTRKLMDEGRLDDLRRCTEDPAYRKRLLCEMQNGKE